MSVFIHLPQCQYWLIYLACQSIGQLLSFAYQQFPHSNQQLGLASSKFATCFHHTISSPFLSTLDIQGTCFVHAEEFRHCIENTASRCQLAPTSCRVRGREIGNAVEARVQQENTTTIPAINRFTSACWHLAVEKFVFGVSVTLCTRLSIWYGKHDYTCN